MATAESLRISQSDEMRAILYGPSRFDDEVLANVLEPDVSKQVATGIENLPVNISILERYQCSPEMIRIDVIAEILGLSLTALPQNHFTTCLCLIPDRYWKRSSSSALHYPSLASFAGPQQQQQQAVVAADSLPSGAASVGEQQLKGDEMLIEVLEEIVALFRLANKCDFQSFWKLCSSSEHLQFLKKIKGFDLAIRKYAMRLVSTSHLNIPIKSLALLLNLETTSPLLQSLAVEFGYIATKEGLFVLETSAAKKSRKSPPIAGSPPSLAMSAIAEFLGKQKKA